MVNLYTWSCKRSWHSLSIELVATEQDIVGADAVRAGGVATLREAEASGRRWEEGAIQYTQYNGAPLECMFPMVAKRLDPASRSRWVSWDTRPADAIYLSCIPMRLMATPDKNTLLRTRRNPGVS